MECWKNFEEYFFYSPPQDEFEFDVKFHSEIVELVVSVAREFMGILVTTGFYEAEREPDMSLGHWWINDSYWFKAVEDTQYPCGITHKKYHLCSKVISIHFLLHILT